MKLNLGCGQNKRPGYVNVDKHDACSPDQVVDLESLPWPWPTDSADEILMIHVLEHLGQDTEVFLGIVKELHRVLRPGAELIIRVPHPRSESFLGDPTHVRPISPAILTLFSKRNNREWKETGSSNTPLGFYLDVDLEIISLDFSLTPRWTKRFESGELTREQLDEAVESFNNVVNEFTIKMRKVA